MLRQAVIGAEQLVIHRLGYKFAVSQEKAFLTGTGVNQQLGVHAIASGISTDRDVSTGNTTTAIGFDGLIEAKFSIKSQYWRNATWLFHRDAIKGISKLKDGQGQYLWSQSVREGEPDRILGMPMVVSEFVPNTFDRQVCRSVRRLQQLLDRRCSEHADPAPERTLCGDQSGWLHWPT
jgi:HK97 family phage major capsid protein